MSSRQKLFVILLCTATGPASAQNLLKVKDGRFHCIGTFEMRGTGIAGWPAILEPADKFPRRLQPLGYHGQNTLAISLQGPNGIERFFSPDGETVSPEAGRAFTQFSFRTRDHGFVMVANLFSARKEDWLATADAYRNAVQAAARLIHAKHSSVLIVGDVFGPTEWDSGCPYPMTDPEALIELCRLIKEVRPDTVVALPAHVVHASSPPRTSQQKQALFYASGSVEHLQQLVDAVRNNREAEIDGVAVCRKAHIYIGEDADDDADALKAYLLRVERERLDIQLPPPPVRGTFDGQILTPAEQAGGWIPLFNGRSLEDWTTLTDHWGAWSIEEGAIKCHGANGAWLRTRRRFDDFILRLEFKISPGGNSGVFIRAPYDGRASRFGMEVQIFGKTGPKRDTNTPGAIYGVLPPLENAAREPGSWNTLDIACRGTWILVALNGTVVQDFDIRQIPEIQHRLERGCVGLQDHGNPVWFRKIRIKDLSKGRGASP